MMKHLTRSRGAAAALLLTTFAPVVGAQVVEPARARPRDSVVVRVFGGSGVLMDSLKTLLRAWEHEPYGSADWTAITRQVDSLLLDRREFMGRALAEAQFARARGGFAPTGWLGFVTQGPSQQTFDRAGQHVIYFAYPQIITVDPNSPAERAGIAPGDTLLAYNGLDVVNRDFNVTELLRPDHKVAITIRRDGENKDFAVRVARGPQRIKVRRQDLDAGIPPELRIEAPEMPEGPMRVPMPAMAPSVRMPPGMVVLSSNFGNVMFGANLQAVSAALAKALNLKVGVLATEVPEDSPAWRDGLRPGDVIVSVQDVPVRSVNDFRERVMTHLQQHSVELQVVRNQKPRAIKLSWPSP